MRVILSRKGVDSVAGGMPSPVLGGRPVPLPIPAGRWPGAATYADVGLGAVVERLSNGRLAATTPCHLDPDIDRDRLAREPGWRGAFGQCGAAQGHLDRCGVGPGDLFLFFGLYRDAAEDAVDGLRFRGARRHLIYGWLQIAEVLRGDELPGWPINRTPAAPGRPTTRSTSRASAWASPTCPATASCPPATASRRRAPPARPCGAFRPGSTRPRAAWA